MANIHDYVNFALDATEVVQFKLIRKKEDLQDDTIAFSPAMAHQIFGDQESIFGYQDLIVRVFYTAGPLHIYVGLEYSDKVDRVSEGVIKADNVIGTIAEKLPDGCFFVNMDEFLKTLDKADKFKPFGEKFDEYHYRNQETGEERFFEFYSCDQKITSFLKFFSRLQTFVLWFVDAASYIDVDDPQWNYFICYEKYKNDNGDYQYATVGYSTVYEYYAYPENIRPRISQMLILPPFQKLGLGTRLLKTIYIFYQSQKKVIDITVEDPSDEFQKMRNYVDAKRCQELSSFTKIAVRKGFNKEMIREARETLKLNPRQCRRVYEILRLLYTNVHDKDDYTNYRLDIKKRLNTVFYKQVKNINRFPLAKLDPVWLSKQIPTLEKRLEQLQEEFEEIEKDYLPVVEKLR